MYTVYMCVILRSYDDRRIPCADIPVFFASGDARINHNTGPLKLWINSLYRMLDKIMIFAKNNNIVGLLSIWQTVNRRNRFVTTNVMYVLLLKLTIRKVIRCTILRHNCFLVKIPYITKDKMRIYFQINVYVMIIAYSRKYLFINIYIYLIIKRFLIFTTMFVKHAKGTN